MCLAGNTEPPTEIAPIGAAILDGCSGQNPPAGGLVGESQTGAPALGGRTISNTVAFVENDAIEGSLRTEITLVVDDLGIGSDPNGSPTCGFRRSSDRSGKGPFSLPSAQMKDGKAASLQLFGPSSDECRRANNEITRRSQRRRFDEGNALEGLAEPHVVPQDAATTDRSPDGLPLQHEADSMNLVGQKGDVVSGVLHLDCRARGNCRRRGTKNLCIDNIGKCSRHNDSVVKIRYPVTKMGTLTPLKFN
jgi:hypothetical protein